MDFYEVIHQHPLFIHEIASFLVLSYANTLFDTLRPVHASKWVWWTSVATLVFLDGTKPFQDIFSISALPALCIFKLLYSSSTSFDAYSIFVQTTQVSM